MDTNTPAVPNPWLGRAVVVLLCAQLGLSWVQGRLLQRQHQDLQDLRGEIRFLTESIEQGSDDNSPTETELAPARHPRRLAARGIQRVASISMQEEAPDPAAKELEAAKASAEKAVKDAREVQGKLSLEENARKAEEKAKIQAVQGSTTKWYLLALGAGLVALVVRAWLRRRG